MQRVGPEYAIWREKEEGFSSTPYDDKGFRTNGFGMQVKKGDPENVTVDEARSQANNHQEELEKVIDRRIERPITLSQRKAILDSLFNEGETRLAKRKFFDIVNTGSPERITRMLKTANKARNQKTGKLEVMDVLARRANTRAGWWSEEAAPQEATSVEAPSVEAAPDETGEMVEYDFDALEAGAGEEITPSGAEPDSGSGIVNEGDSVENDDLLYDFDALEAEAYTEATPTQNTAQRANGLDFVASVSDEESAQQEEDALKLARQIGVLPSEAAMQLKGDSRENLVMRKNNEIIAENYPAVYEWASSPKNYPLLKTDPDFVLSVERESRNRGFVEDVTGAFTGSFGQINKALIVTNPFTSGKDKAKELAAMDKAARGDKEYFLQENVDRLSKKIDEPLEGIERGLQKIADAFSKKNVDIADVATRVVEMAHGGQIAGHHALKVLIAAATEPRAAVIMAAQSSSSSLAPMSTGLVGRTVGGALSGVAIGKGAMSAPLAVVGGVLGAFAAGAPLQYSEQMAEEFEAFRDPTTGIIDYQAFYADTVNAQAAHERSLVRAGVGGLWSSLQFRHLFKIGVDAAKNEVGKQVSKNIVKRGVQKVLPVVEGLATQSLMEGVEETSATTAVDLYDKGSDITVKDMAKNIQEGAIETAIAVPSSAATVSSAHVTGKIISKLSPDKNAAARRKASKVKTAVKDIKDAFDGFEIMSRMKEVLSKRKNKDDKGATESLIRATLQAAAEEKQRALDSDYNESDIETVSPEVVESEAKKMEDLQGDHVSLNAGAFQKIIEASELDETADAVARRFGEGVYKEYVLAKEQGGSFNVDLVTWYMETEDIADLTEIASLNSSTLNAVEAKLAWDELEANSFDMFTEEQSTPPPIPQDSLGTKDSIEDPDTLKSSGVDGPPEFIQVQNDTDENPSDSPVLRTLSLFSKHANNEEREVFISLRREMNKAVKNLKGMDADSADIIADVQFKRLKNRAAATGRNLRELAKEFKVEASGKVDDNTLGYFSPTPGKALAWTIVFHNDAKVDTVVHELGHSWLHEMGRDWQFIHDIKEEELTFEQREYKFAMDHLAKEFGVEDLKKISDYSPDNNDFKAKRKEIHERFAQTTEKYFFEGKFTDSRMKKVLETLRKYMIAVGRAVGEAYHQYPALTINPKVERVFNGILGVSKKQNEILNPMFPDGEFDPSLMGAKSEEYLELLRDLEDDAAANFYAKAYKESFRANEKKIKEIEKEAEKQAVAIVDQRPSMRMLNGFKVAYKAFKDGEIDQDPRISYSTFLEDMANRDKKYAAALKKRIPRDMVAPAKKGGVPIREVMAALGIGDRKEMAEMLLEAGRRDDLINAEINNIANESLPLIKTDEELHDIAVEAVNGTSRSKIIRFQLDAMVKKAFPDFKKLIKVVGSPASDIAKKLDADYIKSEAINILINKKVKGFNINSLYRESEAKARLATKYMLKGDFKEALEAKQQQAVYHHAYRLAQIPRKRLGRSNAIMKRMVKTKDIKLARSYDMDMVAYIRTVVQTLQAGSKKIPELNVENFTNAESIQDAQVQHINQKISEYVRVMGGESPSDTTIGAFLYMADAIDAMVATARNAKKTEIGNRKYNTHEYSLDLVSEFKAASDSDPVREANVILRDLKNPISLLKSFFSSEEDFARSKMSEIYDQIVSASANMDDKFTEAKTNIDKAINAAIRKDKGLTSVWGPVSLMIPSRRIKDSKKVMVHVPELGATMAKSEFLRLLAYMGSESGAEKALRGGSAASKNKPFAKWDHDKGAVDETGFWKALDRMIEAGDITKADMDIVQKIWDAFRDVNPEVRNAIKYTKGTNMGHVDARPFTNKLGSFTGGYIPVDSDKAYSTNRGHRDGDFDVDKGDSFTPELYPTMNVGMTEQRDKNYYPVNLDLGSIIYSLKSHMKVGYMSKPLYDAGKVLNTPTVRDAMEELVPGSVKDGIIPWFDRALLQQYSVGNNDFINIAARKMRKATYNTVFMTNVTSVLKQPLGLLPGIEAVGTRRMSDALTQTTTQEGFKKHLDIMTSKDVRMKSRVDTLQKNLTRTIDELDSGDGGWINKGQKFNDKYSMFFIQSMQTRVDVVVWTAAYEKGLSMELTEAQAVTFASNTVDTTQSSSDIATISNIQHGNDVQKLFTMLGSVPLAMFNKMYVTHAQNRDANGLAKAKAMTNAALLNIMLPAIGGAIILEISGNILGKFDDEKEKKEYSPLKNIALNSAIESFENVVPYIGRAGMALLLEREASLSPAFTIYKTGQRAFQSAFKVNDGVTLSSWEYSGVMNFFSAAANLPFTILGKAVIYDEAWESPREKHIRKAKRRSQLKLAAQRKKARR